jgi:hypothetical protein
MNKMRVKSIGARYKILDTVRVKCAGIAFGLMIGGSTYFMVFLIEMMIRIIHSWIGSYAFDINQHLQRSLPAGIYLILSFISLSVALLAYVISKDRQVICITDEGDNSSIYVEHFNGYTIFEKLQLLQITEVYIERESPNISTIGVFYEDSVMPFATITSRITALEYKKAVENWKLTHPSL